MYQFQVSSSHPDQSMPAIIHLGENNRTQARGTHVKQSPPAPAHHMTENVRRSQASPSGSHGSRKTPHSKGGGRAGGLQGVLIDTLWGFNLCHRYVLSSTSGVQSICKKWLLSSVIALGCRRWALPP